MVLELRPPCLLFLPRAVAERGLWVGRPKPALEQVAAPLTFTVST